MGKNIILKGSKTLISIIIVSFIVSIIETITFNKIIVQDVLNTVLEDTMDWVLIVIFNFILTLCAFIVVYLIGQKHSSKAAAENNIDSLFVLIGAFVGLVSGIIWAEPIMICAGVILGLVVAGIVRATNENGKKTVKKSKK